MGSGPRAGAVRGWITTGLARVAGEWSPGPGRLPTHPPRDERRPRVTCPSPSSFGEGPIRKDPEQDHEAVSGRLSSRGGSRSSAALRACRPSPRPRPQCPGAPVLWVPVSLAESTGRPSLLARGENEEIVDGDVNDTWVPYCCQPREANATTEGSASEIQSPSHPRPRDPYSSPGQKGRAVPDLGSKPWGPGGWIPLCLVSAPGGVSAGALSRGPKVHELR